MSENTNQAELSPQEKRSSLLSHLLALRKVVVISAIALVAAFLLVFYLAIEQLMAWIINPIQARRKRRSACCSSSPCCCS